MRKLISTALSATTVMSMIGIAAIPVSASDTKATIYVSDFSGAVYDKGKTTQTQLANKAVSRGSYEFEVGDLVNVTVAYQSSNPSAISGYVGHTFINQSSATPTSADAFKVNTDSVNNTMVLTDKYYANQGQNAGTYIVNEASGTMLMTVPESAVEGSTAEISNPLKDRVSYTASTGAQAGIPVSTEKKVVTFTVEIKNATTSYLYSTIEDAVDTSDAVNSVGENVSVKTTLTKVGHVGDESVAEVSKSIQVAVGDIVVFNVKAKSASQVSAFGITTNYTSSEFGLYTSYSKDGVNTIVASQGGTEYVNTKTAGKITTNVSAASGSNYNISTVTNLQTVKLVAKKNGTFTISATLDYITDKDGKSIKKGSNLSVTSSSSITVADPDKIGAVSKSIFVNKGDVIVYTVKAKTNSKIGTYTLVTKYNADAFDLYTSYSTDGVTTMKLNQGGTESVRTKTAGTINVTATAASGSPYTATTASNIEIVKLVAKKSGTFTLSTTIKSMASASGTALASTSVKFTNTSSVVA